MKTPRTLLLGLFLGIIFASHCEASTNYYVDPDWTGVQLGTASQPWNALSASAWTTINATLASDDATIYFSALKADGITQQSRAWFIQCRRTDYGPHRLTLDGYSFYNSSETSPSWLPNPDTDINHAYQNHKAFKTTGDGTAMALGWTRVDGNDFVLHNGLYYCCIESHLASSDNEPGVGPNWQLYWDQHGNSGAAWSSATAYKCYAKQNNITVRGFEVTGTAARSAASGDNLIWEYNYMHDVTNIGPGLQLNYTSTLDSFGVWQIVARPSTNMTFRNFRIERTYGEGFYLGAINPDAPFDFQVLHGNQYSHLLIENFVIVDPAINGGQGDAIDGKNGITYLTIRLGDISRFGRNGNGINLGYSATNTDQHILVERNFIHDVIFDNLGAQRAIHAQAGDARGASLYGFNGVTIRNNIIANCLYGIQFDGGTIQPATYGFIYNNTIYGATSLGLSVSVNVSNTEVKNNFVFGGANPQGLIGASGVVSDYNAHDGKWSSASEGNHTLTLTRAEALAAVVEAARKNFHLITGTALIGAGQTQSSFSDDYDGITRTVPWDISALKYVTPSTPTPTPTLP